MPIHEIYERWISRYEQGRLEALSPELTPGPQNAARISGPARQWTV